jgi:predicted RNA-binding Zn-ribbon protein involved in translation (DUF1610 family)/DNA polymerase elongation subunit (family B)
MKILTLDIETSPHISVHFGRWQQNISPDWTLEESRILCWAAKWLDFKTVHFSSEWTDGFEEMMGRLYAMLDEADVVVGFNSNKFDIKRINAEFLRLGWTPPSPYQKVDLLLQAKKHFAFSSNKLKHLLLELGLTPKIDEKVDMQLWMDVCVHKKAAARKLMKEYNKQDVLSTEELYGYLLGWIEPHPNWGLFVNDEGNTEPTCPNCGSQHVVKHKVRRTKVRVYQQYHCQDCGAYSKGRKNIGLSGTDNGILG